MTSRITPEKAKQTKELIRNRWPGGPDNLPKPRDLAEITGPLNAISVTQKQAATQLSNMKNELICCVCFDDETPLDRRNVLTCQNNHALCKGCETTYVQNECAPDGRLLKEITNSTGETSPIGALPCAYFVHGDCSCGALDENQMWDRTQRATKISYALGLEHVRKLQEQDAQDLTDAHAAESDARAAESLFDYVLTRAQTMTCPQCGVPCEKNDECIHMKCSQCETHFCYICGQKVAVCRRGQGGCDEHSCYIENHPGYQGLSGDEAKWLFHKRLVLFDLSVLKRIMTDEMWRSVTITKFSGGELRVCKDTHSISLDDIDGAELPVLLQNATPQVKAREAQRRTAAIVASWGHDKRYEPVLMKSQSVLLQASELPAEITSMPHRNCSIRVELIAHVTGAEDDVNTVMHDLRTMQVTIPQQQAQPQPGNQETHFYSVQLSHVVSVRNRQARLIVGAQGANLRNLQTATRTRIGLTNRNATRQFVNIFATGGIIAIQALLRIKSILEDVDRTRIYIQEDRVAMPPGIRIVPVKRNTT